MTTNRILVVDDEVAIRNFLTRVLRLSGYDVQSACDGNEALEYLAQAPYNVLLTDIKMDLLDGVELLRVAKERYPDIAVILLTGHATVASAIAALRHGAHNYLLKPAKNEEILSAVTAALAQQAQHKRRQKIERIAEQLLDVVQPGETAPLIGSHVDAYGDLWLDSAAFRARLNDAVLDLTPTEFRLLREFAQHPGNTLGYINLVQAACGYTCARHEAREIIGTHVLNLRRKMGIAAGSSLYIESIRGIGYRMIPLP